MIQMFEMMIQGHLHMTFLLPPDIKGLNHISMVTPFYHPIKESLNFRLKQFFALSQENLLKLFFSNKFTDIREMRDFPDKQKQIFLLLFLVKKTNGHLRTASNFILCNQKINGRLGAIVNFLFHCKTTNGRLGTTVKFRMSL